MAAVLAITGILAAVLLASDIRKSIVSQKTISRNSYGEGTVKKQLEISADGQKIEEPIEIEIMERQYTAGEIQEVFRRAAEQIERLALAENESAEKVQTDLNLVTSIPDEPVKVEWELDRYDIMDINGKLHEETVEELEQKGETGILVQLKAYLTYTEDETKQAMHEMTVRVYPPVKTKTEKLIADIKTEISRIDTKSKTKETIKLPEKSKWKGNFVLLSYGLPGINCVDCGDCGGSTSVFPGQTKQEKRTR